VDGGSATVSRRAINAVAFIGYTLLATHVSRLP
jgi:hypothetical protein